MNFTEILEKKRDDFELDKEEIKFFIDEYTSGKLPDYQAAAFLMAGFLNGFSKNETSFLTQAMLYSGEIVDLSSIPGIKVDKHSTGGVGDKTSLIIAPICAACGVPVPMISGRGLGHSGGTLDKLESIKGFNVNLSLEDYKKIVKEVGLCLIGQTKEIAPADKKIYALRDVTSTVENKSLIAASIMSKKLAEGIDALVLDVKTGKGAFMKTQKDSEALAKLLISSGKSMNKNVIALITDMNQPLGSHIGNSLEVIESLEILKGICRPEQEDLRDLSIELAAYMILLGKKATSLKNAKELARKAIKNLSAFNKFKTLVKAQGGNEKMLDDFSLFPAAQFTHLITSPSKGYLKELNALSIGKGAVILDAGRANLDSIIDHAVGVIVKKKVGNKVEKGETIFEIKYNSEDKLKASLKLFETAYSISNTKVDKLDLIKKVIGA